MSSIINLETLYNINSLNNEKILALYLSSKNNLVTESFKEHINENEVNSILALYDNISSMINKSQVDGFIYGYKSENGMNEEFDLLRFNENQALNIELKSRLPKKGIKGVQYQMQRHEHLLKNCRDDVLIYTYLKENNTLYQLIDNEITQVSFLDLVCSISDEFITQNPMENVNLSSIIISPYSEPDKFLKSKYYLNENQKDVSLRLLQSNSKKNALIGGAGTGKSLILFDLAKKYRKLGKKVLLIFCAKLTNSEDLSRLFEFDIIPITLLRQHETNYNNFLSEYDVIMIDESQRLYDYQFNELLTLNNLHLIFSVDGKQTLHSAEISLDIENQLIENEEVSKFYLKDKIRTNPELSSFIRKFLKYSESNVQPYKYDNVDIAYFHNENDAIEFIDNKRINENYTVIQLTEYITKQNGNLKREKLPVYSNNVHSVIGMEYDKILVPIDKYFYYNSENKLDSRYGEYYPYDHHNSIFEALTRVKRKIYIVVIDNIEILEILFQLLNWWKTSK